MNFVSSSSSRLVWESEILDFLTVRAGGYFQNWTPHSVPEISQLLSRRDWESILLFNVTEAEEFWADLTKATTLAARELRRDSTSKPSVAKGRLRGRVLVRETLRRRQRTGDPTVWVVGRTRQLWETPENRAIVGFLSYVRDAAEFDAFGHGVRADEVALIDRLLSSEPMRHVRPDGDWRSFVMPPWVTAQSQFYQSIWKWAEVLREAASTRDSVSLRRTLLNGWLSLEDENKVFEIYALSKTIECVFLLKGWDVFEFRLAGMRGQESSEPGGASVLLASRANLRVEVRLDNTPPISGLYGPLLKHYRAMDGRGRRPDVQVLIYRGETLCGATLIEVKNTTPGSQYGRDSVVKVFGYLKDYAALWPVDYPVAKAMLLLAHDPEATVDLGVRIANDEVLLTSPASFENDLRALLKAQFE